VWLASGNSRSVTRGTYVRPRAFVREIFLNIVTVAFSFYLIINLIIN
jgi:hypothetical protein